MVNCHGVIAKAMCYYLEVDPSVVLTRDEFIRVFSAAGVVNAAKVNLLSARFVVLGHGYVMWWWNGTTAGKTDLLVIVFW